MNLPIRIFSVVIANFLLVSGQKTDDGSRPYEFGFTIDGQQHRHEKKDVNGIIQGEFGFITADGIYHVTVYATDENGNFKILSMRNIRISAPLDGSPLPPGAKIESNQYTSNQVQSQPQKQISNPLPTPVKTLNQNQIQRVQATTPSKATFIFTTQPTIKPACGGCGYVTTPKPRPGQRFPFQTPAFQKPVQQGTDFTGTSTPERNSGYPNQNNNGPNHAIRGGSNLPNEDIQNSTPNYSIFGSSVTDSQSNLNRNAGNTPVNAQNSKSTYPNQKLTNPTRNEIGVGNPSRNPLSAVSVSNGTIHVPGNPDIQIRDKFPGMNDGLPPGITEKDITDLLYKFNYTVGFHGHYEKGLKNGAKVGGYFVTGRDGISRIVTYVADENGFRPKVKFVRLDLNSDEVPKEGTEKKFGLKNFEFVWYPVS